MKLWVVGGSAVAVAAAWVCLAMRQPPALVPPHTPEPAVVIAPATPPEPAPLAAVVDVTDIDVLLDPPAAVAPTVTPVSFEEAVAPPTVPAPAVKPIPPAKDFDDLSGVTPVNGRLPPRLPNAFIGGYRPRGY